VGWRTGGTVLSPGPPQPKSQATVCRTRPARADRSDKARRRFAGTDGTKDSPLRRTFRPPTERTFESPLRSLRLDSTSSAALSGAGRKLTGLSRPRNRQFRKVREKRHASRFQQRCNDRIRTAPGRPPKRLDTVTAAAANPPASGRIGNDPHAFRNAGDTKRLPQPSRARSPSRVAEASRQRTAAVTVAATGLASARARHGPGRS